MGAVLMKLCDRCKVAAPATANVSVQALACAMYTRMIDSPEAKRCGVVSRYVLYCWISGDSQRLCFPQFDGCLK